LKALKTVNHFAISTVLNMTSNGDKSFFSEATLSRSISLGIVALSLALSAGAQSYSVLKSFTGVDGQNPGATLLLSGNTLYGTTYAGGLFNAGAIFKINTNGTGFRVLTNFVSPTHSNGASPRADLVLSGSTLYGTTAVGGVYGGGTVFKLSTNGTGLSTILPLGFDTSRYPRAGVVLAASTVYGVTYGGPPPSSPQSYGALFKVNTDGTGYLKMLDFMPLFPTDPQNPYAGLMRSGAVLYGTTYSGGNSSVGTVFKFNTNGTGFAVLTNFAGVNGARPRSTLLLSGSTLYGVTEMGGTSSQGTIFKLNTNGTGLTVLKHFTGSDGATPIASLVLAGSSLYGTTYYGGNANAGTVFKLNTNGSDFVTLKHFGGTDGENPAGGLVMSGSQLYGTTYSGGDFGNGVVFALNLSPTLSATNLAGDPGVTWQAIEGLTYQVQYKTNLNQNTWSNLDNPITANGPTVTVPTPPGSNARRFFRVLVPQ
jgi:uncharacterized repeat protein (TIGR03803 family)